jgi:hypothetical protein
LFLSELSLPLSSNKIQWPDLAPRVLWSSLPPHPYYGARLAMARQRDIWADGRIR